MNSNQQRCFRLSLTDGVYLIIFLQLVRYSVELVIVAPFAVVFMDWAADPSLKVAPVALFILFDLILNSIGVIFCFLGAFSMWENRKKRFKYYLIFSFVMTFHYIISTLLSIYGIIAFSITRDLYSALVRYVVGMAFTAAFMIFFAIILSKYWRNWKHKEDIERELA
ncbi:hypothetical protein BKA69DRAFT_677434 [Paraphysoderma sedebokerense]|nr:hypothetical protein BKA69DRAFT_677434 [Paraphysoderma sedebokerense]